MEGITTNTRSACPTDIVQARKEYERAQAWTDRVRFSGVIPVESLRSERECAQRLVSTVAAWYEERYPDLPKRADFAKPNVPSSAWDGCRGFQKDQV